MHTPHKVERALPHADARARPGSAWQRALARLPFTAAARALRLRAELAELWGRQQSDDLLLIFLSLIDAYVTKARAPAAREPPPAPCAACTGAPCDRLAVTALSMRRTGMHAVRVGHVRVARHAF